MRVETLYQLRRKITKTKEMAEITIKICKGGIEAPVQIKYGTDAEYVKILDTLFDYGYSVKACTGEDWTNIILSHVQSDLLMDAIDDLREVSDVSCISKEGLV